MKKALGVAILSVMMVVTGCAHRVTAPLPQGAITQLDADVNTALQAGHAAVTQYQADVKSGFVPAPALKIAVQDLAKAIDIAAPIYQTWHTALKTNPQEPEPTELKQQITTINTKLSNLNLAAK